MTDTYNLFPAEFRKIYDLFPAEIRNHIVEIAKDYDGVWIYFDDVVGDYTNDYCHTLHAESTKDLKQQIERFVIITK